MKVGIVGTGSLGPGIAQVFAQCDEVEKVILCKGKKESKRNGKDQLEKNLSRLVEKEKISKESMDFILNKIITGNMEDLRDVDLVEEAVSEDLEIKKTVFKRLDEICKPECFFVTNTFFNPAPVMNLVEIISCENTPKEILDFLMDIARKIDKTPVEVKEAPGFIVNRILIPMINEAIGIYAEGVATAESIDTAMRLGANHPMGPLALGDLIGLDIVLAILNEMLKETGDIKYRPEALLKRMVRERKLGRKTGEGFYQYS